MTSTSPSSGPVASTEPSNARLVQRLLGLSWHYRASCLAVFCFQVGLLLLGLSGLGLTGLAIDVVRSALDPHAPKPRFPFGVTWISDWSALPQVLAIGLSVLLMAAVRAVFSYFYAIAVGKLVHLEIVPELRTRVFDKLQRLSFRFFDENASGSIINRVTSDVQSVRSFVDGVLLQGAIMLLSLGLYLAYMLSTHVGLSLASLLLTPAIWWLTKRFSAWARPAYQQGRELVDDVVLAMSEGIHGIQVTKTFGLEPHQLERFGQKNAAVQQQQQSIFKRVSRFGPTVGFIGHIDVAVLLVYGGYLVSQATLTIGNLIVFAGLLQQFSGQVSSMAGIINTLQQSLAGARRVFEVLDAQLEVESPKNPRALPIQVGHVRFEGVAFAYNAGEPVLERLDFEAKPGQRVAILGLTGAGKTTLLGLIPRFHDVTSGRVTLGGVDVRELQIDELRRKIGIVFQESLLFRSSIAENIAFGHPEASREQIERAAQVAGAHQFIVELPKGYDTVLEEGAVNLSGGQRQRIAIARALLLQPTILLLDDPTTAVDPATEHEVLGAMDDAMAGRTTLVVANRLSTLRRADLILVLHDGLIVERGTHAELMELRGMYYRSAALQAADSESQALLQANEVSA